MNNMFANSIKMCIYSDLKLNMNDICLSDFIIDLFI